MTHSLHRQGSKESLKNDYVFLCTPAMGKNSMGIKKKLEDILDILLEVGPINIGFYGYGSIMTEISWKEIRENLRDNSRLRCCFDDKEKVKEVLRRIKSKDFGLSITISGLISELLDMSRELSLTPHTINISCGIFGKVDLLPEQEILEISTMCGHGLISHRLVKDVIRRLRGGKIHVKEAVQILGAPCTCGIFNPSRAYKLLDDIVGDEIG